jgi:Flp pilus assembly protein protease CpaA
MIPTIAGSLFFASTAALGIYASLAICAGIHTDEHGPPPGRPPYLLLIAAAGALGALLVHWQTTPLQLGIAALVAFALVASWCSDSLCGIVPDAFTLGPLGALLIFSLAQHDWEIGLSAFVAFAPFALAAALSRGYGMGWGDAKLVALIGAAVGAPLAVFALSAACMAAVVVHRIAGARGVPIAFAPYIAASTAMVLPLGLLR